MNSLYSHELKKKLAYKYGLSIKEVDIIVKSVFELTSKTISSGDKFNYKFKNIHVPNFGMFKVKQGRLHNMKLKYGYKNDTIGDNEEHKDNNSETTRSVGDIGGDLQQED